MLGHTLTCTSCLVFPPLPGLSPPPSLFAHNQTTQAFSEPGYHHLPQMPEKGCQARRQTFHCPLCLGPRQWNAVGRSEVCMKWVFRRIQCIEYNAYNTIHRIKHDALSDYQHFLKTFLKWYESFSLLNFTADLHYILVVPSESVRVQTISKTADWREQGFITLNASNIVTTIS